MWCIGATIYSADCGTSANGVDVNLRERGGIDAQVIHPVDSDNDAGVHVRRGRNDYHIHGW